MFPSRTWSIGAGLLMLVSSLSISEPLTANPSAEPPPGPGLELIQRSCVGCHDIYMITTKRKTPEQWATTVGLMADRGAEITPDEMQIIEDYLSQNFSTSASAAAQ